MNILTRAYACAPLLLMLATLGWAGNVIASRLAAEEASPMLLIFMRWGLVTVVVGIVARQRIKPFLFIARRHILWLLLMGLGFSLFNGLFYWAAHYTTAINLGIIQSMVPAFILIGAFFCFKEHITKLQNAGLFVTFIGAVLVIGQGSLQVLLSLTFNPGILIMMVACLCYAGYALGLRNRPAMSAFVMMWFITAASWLATVPLVLIEAGLGAVRFPGPVGWLLLIYITLVPSFLSEIFFMRGVDLIGPARAGLYTNLVPVYTAILGIVLLGETLQYYHFIALLLAFGGIYLFERGKKRAG